MASNRLLDVTTYTDKEIQTRGDLLDLPLSMELGAIHGEMADQSIMTSAFNFGQNQVVKATEQKLSVQELNDQYGEEGLVKFEEPEYPTVAKRIRTNKIQAAQRAAILQQDAYDNNIGTGLMMGATALGTGVAMDPFFLIAAASGVGGVAAGSLMSDVMTAGKMRNFVAAMETISKTPGIRTANTIAEGIHASTTPAKLGAFGSGFVRSSIPLALEQMASEPLIYLNAKENGYDYDVMQAFMFSLGAVGLVGSIGGHLSQSIMKASKKGIGSVFDSIEKAAAANFEYVDNALAKGYVSEQLYTQLLVKAQDNLVTGRPFELDYVRAAMRLDDTGRATDDFMNKLRSGEYDNIFSETQKQDILNLSHVNDDFVRSTNFKRWATMATEQVDDYGRHADNLRLSRELNLEGASLPKVQARVAKVSRLLNSTTKRLREIEDNLLLLSEEVSLRTGKAKKFALKKIQELTGEKQKLKLDANDFEAELRKTKSLEKRVMNDELEVYFNRASEDRVAKMTFDEFKAEVKSTIKSLKDKKYPDITSFGKLAEDTKQQLARLFYLANRDDIYGLDLKDIMRETSDLDLLQAYQKHMVKDQIEELSFDEAASLLKKEIVDADHAVVKKLDEIIAQKEITPAVERAADDFLAEIEDYKQYLNDDELKEFDEISKQIDAEVVNKEEALSAVVRCMGRR
jgi:hypothetical protein